MTSNLNKKGVPTTATPSNINCGKCTACTCETQAIPITRKDIFAAVALHALMTKQPDADPVATATMCYTIAARMEFVARAKIGGTR